MTIMRMELRREELELQLGTSHKENMLLKPFQYVPAMPLCIASGKKSDVKGAHPRTVIVPPGTYVDIL